MDSKSRVRAVKQKAVVVSVSKEALVDVDGDGKLAELRWKLLLFGVQWRLLIIAVSNFLFEDWPHDPDEAFRATRDPSTENPWLEAAFGGLARWDAEYFMDIASRGYTSEQSAAFFPAWPVLLSSVASLLVHGVRLVVVGVSPPLFSSRSALLVSGVGLNFLVSLLSADAFFRLTTSVVDVRKTRGMQWCYYAAVLFCVSPASVYFSALYSEALFSWLTFEGLYWLYGRKSMTMATLLFTAAAFTRSNGAVNAGFLLHFGLSSACRSGGTVKPKLKFAVLGLVGAVAAAFPFVWLQSYHFDRLCSRASRPAPWCFTGASPYSHVQSVHWGVAPFATWRGRKAPEFLVVCPVFLLCALRYLCSWVDERKDELLSLGGVLPEFWQKKKEKVEEEEDKVAGSEEAWSVFGKEASHAVFWFHGIFLVVFGLVYVYILTLLRFLCSSTPVVTWAAAFSLRDIFLTYSSENKSKKRRRLDFCLEPGTIWDLVKNIKYLVSRKMLDAVAVHVFFLGWALVGVPLFANFITPP